MKQYFELSHWDNPNNIGGSQNELLDQLHGARLAIDVLFYTALKKSEYLNKYILDYGSGTGRVARVMSLICRNIYGYEPNQTLFNIAKEKNELVNNKPYFINELNELADKKFDLIYCCNVIEHLSFYKQIELWHNIIQLAKNNALFFISYHVQKNKESLNKFLHEDYNTAIFNEDDVILKIAMERGLLGIQSRCFIIVNQKLIPFNRF